MHRPFALACALALGLAACGSDASGPGSFPPALVGSWEAGSACAAAGCAITARVVGSNVVIPLTDSVTLDVQIAAGGGVVSSLAAGGQAPRIVQGTARASGNTLVVAYPDAPSDTIVYAFQGSLLRFDFQNAILFPDVTGDGAPDRVRMSVLLAGR